MFIRYDVRVRFSGHVQKCVNGLKYNVRSDQFMNVYVYSTPGAEGARVESVCANRFRVQGFRLVRHAWAGGRGSVGKLGGQGRAGQGGVGWGTGCAGQAGRGLRPPAWCAVRVGRS